MAGFVGWYCDRDAPAEVGAALACLRHHRVFKAQVLAGDNQAGTGVVFRDNDPPELFEDPERSLVVAILGAVVELRNGWHRFSARELAEAYSDHGLMRVAGHDGAYLVLVWDGRAGRLHVLSDRVGSRPVHYAEAGGGVAFAPEAKALFRLLPLKPRIDVQGMVGLLSMGYPVGTRTLFDGVRLLPPAHSLTLDLHAGTIRMERTWAQRFVPEKRLTLEAAADQLYEAVVEAHRAPLGQPGERTQQALTGGYDSRLVLGVLAALGCPPTEAVTWGATEKVPGSDVTVARALAGAAGVPHRFLAYEAEDVAAHAREWCIISELASDNLGYFAAGAHFLYGPEGPPDVLYLGDHVIGLAGMPRTVSEAIETVARVPATGLSPSLEGLLKPEFSSEAARAMREELCAVAGACASDHPKDVQDHLFLRLEAFRWLFSPGFYKEPMVSARRPLLLGPVMDVAARFPRSLRVDKRVLVAMLRRRLPDLMRVPAAGANSLVDWDHQSRAEPGLSSFLRQRTCPEALSRPPLGGLLDPAAVGALVSSFFQQTPEPLDRRVPKADGLVAVRRRLSHTPLVGPLLGWMQPLARRRLGSRAREAGSRVRLIFRLALVRLLQECIEAGEFDSRPCQGSGPETTRPVAQHSPGQAAE